MATPPTLTAVYQVASWTTSGTSKTITFSNAVGDYLAVCALGENEMVTLSTPTGGTGLTWSLPQSIVITNDCTAYIWTATASAANSSATLTIAAGSSGQFGGIMYRWDGTTSDGFGASNKANTTGAAAPSVALTTTAANSAILCINGDFNAAAITSRVWRAINSITPTAGNGLEKVAARSAGGYSAYSAYWNDAGATGAKTAGLTAPSSQAYSIIAIEVKPLSAVNATAAPAVITATVSVPTPALPHQKMDTLTDDFAGGALDSTKWDATNNLGNTGSQTGGRYQFAISNNAATYSWISSHIRYDLTGSALAAQLVNAGDQSITSLEVYPVEAQCPDVDNRAFFVVSGNFVGMYKTVAAGQTLLATTAYSSSTHAWFRLREASGTLYWETSPDASSWTQQWSESTPLDVSAATAYLAAGEYAVEPAGATTVIFDNVNLLSVNATAAPAAITSVTALPRPNVNTSAGPAAITGVVAAPRADVNISTGPAVITGVVAAPRANVNTTAGPAVFATVAGLLAAALNISAGPGVIAAVVALATPTIITAGNATATPAAVVAAASVPQPAVNVSAGPALVTVTVALPQAAENISAGPSAVTAVVAIPRPALNVSAGPATITAVVNLPAAAVNMSAGPVVIPVIVGLATPSVGGATLVSPAVIQALVAIPAPALNASASPGTVAVVVTIPAPGIPSSFGKAESDPAVFANRLAEVAAAAAVAATAAVSSTRSSRSGVGRG